MKSERLANGFLVTSCPTCVREVLVVRDLDPGGELIAACLHCDAVFEEASLRAVDTEILSELGYDVPGAPAPQGSRGCRDGKCGVQQPDA